MDDDLDASIGESHTGEVSGGYEQMTLYLIYVAHFLMRNQLLLFSNLRTSSIRHYRLTCHRCLHSNIPID